MDGGGAPDGGRTKLRVVPPAAGSAPPPPVWAANDFPYALEAGIEHHCVWSAAGEVPPQALQAVLDAHRPPAHWHALLFVNPRHLQSVRNVWHAHVLSRPRTTGGSC